MSKQVTVWIHLKAAAIRTEDIAIRLYLIFRNIIDHLHESVELWVFRGGGIHDAETILNNTIHIQTDYFMNLINLPEEREYRNESFLSIAREILGDI